ncbi:MAG: H-X9-DG-CTERM domain-containing protein [Isosphaeraceae bacterium]
MKTSRTAARSPSSWASTRRTPETGADVGHAGHLRNTGTRINTARLSAGLRSRSPTGDDDDEHEPPAPADGSDPSLNVGGFSSRHPGGANFAFGDGSVRFLKNTISPRVFREAGTASTAS